MSNLLNTYTFLPWLRSGLANSISATDMDEDVKLRAEISSSSGKLSSPTIRE